METRFGFELMNIGEFENWIAAKRVARTIFSVQQHHTYIPNYYHFKGNNHFQLQKGMQHTHKVSNGWRDIGQHFTIFPDGMICTGRSLELNPACIYGFNNNSLCIENLGWFDEGQDMMNPEQRDSIVKATAAICKKFNIPVNSDKIVYHHWFDLATGARTNGSGSTKSCPGTAFFGGNKVQDAEQVFLPLVQSKVSNIPVVAAAVVSPVKYGFVTANVLNIRNKPSSKGKIVNKTSLGSLIRIYDEENGWYKISGSKQEWVYKNFVNELTKGTVTASRLNVRSGPGTTFNAIESLPMNEMVFVYQQQGDWLKISLDDKWVSRDFVEVGA